MVAPVDPCPVEEAWPLLGLRLRAGALELRPVRDEDAPALAGVVERLLPPEQHHFMPRLMDGAPGATPAETTRNILRFVWRQRADLTPAQWELQFAVRRDGRLIGMQAIGASQFAVTREVHTGSYLDREVRAQGVGTAMRAMVLELAFAGLGAVTAGSGYMAGNEASRRVSERLGYEPDGTRVIPFRGRPWEERRLRLAAHRWAAHRPRWLDDLEIVGLEAARPLLVDPAGDLAPQA